MKRYLITVLFIAAIISAMRTTTQGATQNADQTRERAVALWQEAIRAKGGHERLESVQNLLISSTVDVESPSGGSSTETERLYVMPGKAWIYTYTPAFDMSLDAVVMNMDRNFCMATLFPPIRLTRCIPEKPIQYLVQDPVIYLMQTKWVRPSPIGVRTDGKGKKQLDVIETKTGNLQIDFYLDRKTRLPIKLVMDWYGGVTQTTGKLGMMSVKLEDYVAVDGIMMPRRVTREPLDQPITRDVLRRDFERARYRFNVAYAENLFDSPVSKKVKRNDWMP